MSEENDSDGSYTESEDEWDDNTPPMDFDYDSDSKEYSSTATHVLADIQSELDECASNGEMKEGTYIRVSKKLKDSIDRDDTRAYIDYYLAMVDQDTSTINTYVKGINPLDVKIISAVIKMALREKLTENWWECAVGSYLRAIFPRSEIGVHEGDRAQEGARALLKLATIPSCKFKLLLMTECNRMFLNGGCVVCYFEERGVDKSIIDEIIINAPLLYLNVHDCKKKLMHGIDTSYLKNLACTSACRCNWLLPRFGQAVGQLPSECHIVKFGRGDVHLTADHS